MIWNDQKWSGRNFNFFDHIGFEKWFLRGDFFSNRNLKNIFLPIESEYFSAFISGVKINVTCINQKPPGGSQKESKNGGFQGDMRSDFFFVEPPLWRTHSARLPRLHQDFTLRPPIGLNDTYFRHRHRVLQLQVHYK